MTWTWQFTRNLAKRFNYFIAYHLQQYDLVQSKLKDQETIMMWVNDQIMQDWRLILWILRMSQGNYDCKLISVDHNSFKSAHL